jgi:hypothetical protein
MIAILATRGLLYFRTGDTAAGRIHYERAMNQARSLGRRTHLAMAAVMLAREEVLAGTPEAPGAVRKAERLSRGASSKAVAVKEWLFYVVIVARGGSPVPAPLDGSLPRSG